MSSPGLMSVQGNQNGDMSPLTMQQVMEYQRQQQLAQALMAGNNRNPTTQYAGVANAGGDIASALMQNRLQKNAINAQDQVQVTPQKIPTPNNASWLKNLFGMGG